MNASKSDRLKIRKDKPDSWIAVEPGDSLKGQVTDVDQAWSEVRAGGSWYPLLTVRASEAPGYEPGSELKVHAFGAVLYNEVLKRRPEIGETIVITYMGPSEKEPPKGRNAPEIYRLTVEGRPNQAGSIYDRLDQGQFTQDRGHAVPAGVTEGEAAAATDDGDLPF